jgi:hypothetical protein
MLDTGLALNPDLEECSTCLWKPAGEVESDLTAQPDIYSAWFALLFPNVLAHLPR